MRGPTVSCANTHSTALAPESTATVIESNGSRRSIWRLLFWAWIAHTRYPPGGGSEEHTAELQSQSNIACRLLLSKKKKDARVRLILRDPRFGHLLERGSYSDLEPVT